MTNYRIAALIGLVATPALLAAQVCEPPTSSNEAKIFGNRSLAFAHGPGAAPTGEPRGTVRAAVEFALLPPISDDDARPTTCRPGKEAENVNSLPGFARLRVGVSLPADLVAELSWLPPVELEGMQGSVVGLSLSHSRAWGRASRAAVRAHMVFGAVSGPITCNEAALRNSASECFGGTLSDDEFKPSIVGADAYVARRTGLSVAWYAGAGYSRLAPRFQVNFRNASGSVDRTRVEVDLHRVALFAGASWAMATKWRTSAELYATTADGATGRILVDRVFRRGR